MKANTRISIQINHTEKKGRYLTFHLHQRINIQPSVFQASPRIFVVSNPEGNFKPLCKLLRRNGVVDRYLKWTFENNHLVVLGDSFNQQEEATECLWLLYSLEEKAKKEGGCVHFILGDHEIMNINGDWRNKHPKYGKAGGPNDTHVALYDGNNELGRWLRSKNIVEKIGDVLFLRGGLAQELIKLGPSIMEINEKARPYYISPNEKFEDPLLSVLYNTRNAPFRYQGYHEGAATPELIEETLALFGVNTIVTGSSIEGQVNSSYNGKIINVNTDYTTNISEGLMISKGRFYKVTAKGGKERIK